MKHPNRGKLELMKKKVGLLIVLFLIAACTPKEIVSETAIETATPEPSQTNTATSVPSQTATTTLTMMPTLTVTSAPAATETIVIKSNEELAIEAAEEAGIDLFDLKNSENTHVSEQQDFIQRDFENSFGTQEIKDVYIINVGLELNKEFIEVEKFRSTTTLTGDEFEKELTSRIEAALAKIPQTNSGWQHIVYSKDIMNVPEAEKVINPRLVLVPLMSYNANTDELWIKRPLNSTIIYSNGFSVLKNLIFYDGVEKSLEQIYLEDGVFLGPGSIFAMSTVFPDQEWQNNGGLTTQQDIPIYNEQDLEHFRETGDYSIFGYTYEDENGDILPILWPWIELKTNLTQLNNESNN